MSSPTPADPFGQTPFQNPDAGRVPATLAPSVIGTQHSVLVGVMLMIIVLVILVEIAGVSKNAAEATGLLLMGPLLLLGINNSQKFSSWVGNNPIQ